MLHIVSDSSCDLPGELLKEHDIHIVPLLVSIDGDTYREREDITPQQFYRRMAQSKELPKTSQPTPAAFIEMFEHLCETGEVLCITISSGLSGTYQAACVAKEISGAAVTVFDSLGGSLGQGLQVLKAAALRDAGQSAEEITKALEKYRSEMNILILLNTLENIVKGGRLTKFAGAMGKLLDMRVLLHNDSEGKVAVLKKVRGKKNFMKTVLEEIARRCPDMAGMDVGITHFNNILDAETIKTELLERRHARRVIINEMGVTMATYAGEGGMIVSF